MPSTAVSPNAAREDGCAAGPSAAAAAHASRRAARFIALQYRIVTGALADRVCAEVDRAAGELVQLAVDLVARAGAGPAGTIEISGTVDEESGGFAGVAHLAEIGRIGKGRTDFVITPEPLNVDRICVGHRGVYWFQVTAHGRIAHGSMPFLGASAVDGMGRLLQAVRDELIPRLPTRTTAG